MDIPKVQRIILKIIKSCLLLLAVLFLILQLTDPNYDKIGGILAGFVLPFLPEIFECLFKTKFSVRIELAYYIFIFLALDLGFFVVVKNMQRIIVRVLRIYPVSGKAAAQSV